jgi:hypothetical protein
MPGTKPGMTSKRNTYAALASGATGGAEQTDVEMTTANHQERVGVVDLAPPPDDITMTSATNFPVAKSRPRASNQTNQKQSGGTRRVYSQIDGERQGGLG